MKIFSDEEWAKTLPLTTGPVEPRQFTLVAVPAFDTSSNYRTVECAQCGTEFKGRRSTARYCSPTCRTRAFNGKTRGPIQ